MPQISLAGFKDPVTRPRFILWTLVGVLTVAALMIVALGVTSTRWFCAEGCHKVQDDAILAYERSTHAEISCMACHMPVGANPVIFILHKAEALGELFLTVTNNYELPLNAHSHYALTMESRQCTQCHNLAKRPVTPALSLRINHDVHEEEQVTCAICHNRTAHREDFEMTLVDPASNERSHPHEDFMEMTACFRCHAQDKTPEGGLKAPGSCAGCHPDSFELRPESHLKAGFYPKGHAKLAKAEATRVAGFEEEQHEEQKDAAARGGAVTEGGETATQGGEAATEGGEGGHGGDDAIGPKLVRVESLNECNTCHKQKYCDDCHGLPMPHGEDFIEEHVKTGKDNPKLCEQCHGSSAVFCDECHHGTEIGWDYVPSKDWIKEHPKAQKKVGPSGCIDCHEPTFCAKCHTEGVPQP